MQRSPEDERPVRPAGLTVRQLRHDKGFGPRDLVEAIARRSFISSGLRETITPNELAGIEERNEVIPYAILCLIAGGLDCDPIDLLLEELPA